MLKKLASLAAVSVVALAISATAFASPGKVDRSVNFRSAPSTGSNVYRTLSSGTSLDIVSKVNSYWYKVRVDSRTGYVSTHYVSYNSRTYSSGSSSSTPASSKAAAVIRYAKALQGVTHYAYGVNRPVSVMDCSAFTKYVFGKVGVNLKWGTRYQKYAGNYVSRSNLKPGDLIFFRIGSSHSIGHVGIYIGNGQFIHNTPSKNGVGISSIRSGYWNTHYVTARRVL